MNVQHGTDALDELARFDLRVHPVDGTHDELGKRHRTKARIAIDPQAPAGPSIVISIGEGEAKRLVPLTPFEAATMVDELISRGLLVGNERLRHTVEHLLARLSEIYTDLELRSLKLDSVIFSEAGYCIDSAHLEYSHRPPHHGTMQSGIGGRDNVGVHPHSRGGHR